MSASLLQHFAALEDPRVERNQRHALLDIVGIGNSTARAVETGP